jgi:transcriptional regulator with XRE-family HTH domain
MAVETRDRPTLRAKLAHNIRRLRRRLGWSQDRLAMEAGLNRTYLAEIERCHRNVGVDNVEKIARAFDVDEIELFLAERDGTAPADNFGRPK